MIKPSTFLSLAIHLLAFFLYHQSPQAQTDPNHPNILVILADDLGVDYTNGYQTNTTMPQTPNIDAMRSNGLTFKNAWATPRCTPTRAALMSA